MHAKLTFTAGTLLAALLHAATAGAQAMYINTEGNIGVGTNVPDTSIHVIRDDGTAQILVEETNVAVAARTLFALANPGNTKFEIINSDAATNWAFTNSGVDFRVSLQGSGQVEFSVDNNGNATIAGDATLGGLLTELSDRNAKTNITTLDPDTVLEKLTQVPIAQWAYKKSPETLHIGPMAQDFRAAFGTGNSDTTLATMDVGGVAIASIQALARAKDDLVAENGALREKNRELEERLELLEAAITQLLPQTAQQ